MPADPDFDPFADPPDLVETKLAEVAEAVRRHNEEKSEVAEENWISVTFPAHGGYDAPKVTVHGSAEYLAGLFNVKDFDGKISTLMTRVVEIDRYFKKTVGEPAGKG